MAMTADEVLAALETRRMEPKHIDGQGWIVTRGRRGGAVPGVAPQPTLAAAVEAAAAELASREAAAAERRAAKLVALQQRGRHFHRPRLEDRPDGSGGVIQVVVFDIHRAGGAKTAILGVETIIEAYRLLAAAIARGEEP